MSLVRRQLRRNFRQHNSLYKNKTDFPFIIREFEMIARRLTPVLALGVLAVAFPTSAIGHTTDTDEARNRQITGTVVLRAIFAANGRVIGIRAVSGLPGGLTEQAIHAARQIRFVLAIKDGRPVSMFIQLEYNFNLY